MTRFVDTDDGRVEADDGPIGPPPLSARPVILLFKCSESRSQLQFFPIPMDSGAAVLTFGRQHSMAGRVGQAHHYPSNSTSPARSSSKACRMEGRETWRASRGSWRQANRSKQRADGLKGCEMKMARGQSPPRYYSARRRPIAAIGSWPKPMLQSSRAFAAPRRDGQPSRLLTTEPLAVGGRNEFKLVLRSVPFSFVGIIRPRRTWISNPVCWCRR